MNRIVSICSLLALVALWTQGCNVQPLGPKTPGQIAFDTAYKANRADINIAMGRTKNSAQFWGTRSLQHLERLGQAAGSTNYDELQSWAVDALTNVWSPLTKLHDELVIPAGYAQPSYTVAVAQPVPPVPLEASRYSGKGWPHTAAGLRASMLSEIDNYALPALRRVAGSPGGPLVSSVSVYISELERLRAELVAISVDWP